MKKGIQIINVQFLLFLIFTILIFMTFNATAAEEQSCRPDNLNACTNVMECMMNDGYWYDNQCHSEVPCTSFNTCYTEEYCGASGFFWYDGQCNAEPACRPDNLNACTNGMACVVNDGYWYNNQCNASPKPAPSSGGHNAVPSHALSVIDFPTSVNPANNQVQVGNCNDVMIQPTLSVPSSDVGKTATLIIYIYLPDMNFGINIPSKAKVLTSETKFDLLSNAIDFSDGAGLNVYIYYGYILGDDIKYNAYSIVVGSSCSNQVPDCGSITDYSSCNANANCAWQAFPSAQCVLNCSQFADEGTCNAGLNGGCEWNTQIGVCVPK